MITNVQTGNCYNQLCHQSCKEDRDYSISNYYKSKHGNSCIGDAQYANHHCHLFHCASNNCTTLLKTLQKHS